MIYLNSAVEIKKEVWNDPIKHFADDSLFFPLTVTEQKECNIFVRKSHLRMSKGWASMGDNEYDYA